MEVFPGSIISEESSKTQILSANILSNLGGNYAWTGESYKVYSGAAGSKSRFIIISLQEFDKKL